jgi:transmembrane sensor
MDRIGLRKLLEKYKTGACSREELDLFTEYTSDYKNEKQIREILLDDLNTFKADEKKVGEVDFTSIYNKVGAKIDENEQTYDWSRNVRIFSSKASLYFAKIAAVVIFFFAIGGGLGYLISNKLNKQKISYCEIEVPFGATSMVTLPDSSIVWLNAGSKLKYQNLFNHENRQVFLEGEAYFKVAKKRELPFIVNTDNLDIIAVGTEFNVKAYSNESTIETTLIEGCVSVLNKKKNSDIYSKEKEVCLRPSQKAIYIKSQQELQLEEIENIKSTTPEISSPEKGNLYVASEIDTTPIISWKYDRLIFQGEKLNSIAVKLERKYDVTISFNSDEIKKFKFTGTLEDETITQVLDVIKLTAPIDYKLDGKRVEIYENTRMKQKFINYLKDIPIN